MQVKGRCLFTDYLSSNKVKNEFLNCLNLSPEEGDAGDV
jgi:hypothetical protein